MAEISVLVEGVHERDKYDRLVVGSTVTLIKSDHSIVVDTGGFGAEKKIVEGLAKEGLKPEDIEIVVLTHLHLDHLVNVGLFKKARVICKFNGHGYPGQVHYAAEGVLERAEVVDGMEVAKDVEVMLAPGHTEDMITLLVKTADGVVCVAGDAIPSEDFLDENKLPDPLLVFSVEDFKKSRAKIFAKADYIIPGHGKIFKNTKKLS